MAALVISLALLSGFQDRIRAQMAERQPAPPHLPGPRRGPRAIRTACARRSRRSPGVAAVEPAIEGRGWASGVEASSRRSGALPQRAGGRARPGRRRRAAAGADRAAVATRPGSAPGDLIRLTSAAHPPLADRAHPVAIVFRVAAVRRAGGPREDGRDRSLRGGRAAALGDPRRRARVRGAARRSPRRAEAAARGVADASAPGYRVETWRELNAPLSFALRLEKVVIFATVALVILVAALNIVSNIALTVVEKKRDLGVLTALGATPGARSRGSI